MTNADKSSIRRRIIGRQGPIFDPSNIVLLIAVALAVGFAVKQHRDNLKLSSLAANVTGTIAGPNEAIPGDLAPTFRSRAIDGSSTELEYSATRGTLVFLFSPSCDVCLSELPTLNRLSVTAGTHGLSTYGISLDSLEVSRARLSQVRPRFQVLIMPDEATLRAYRTVRIPEVLLVSANGRVQWVHYGALTGGALNQLKSRIENY